jgi:PKD repeat protein
MAILVCSSASADNGNGVSSGSLTLGAVPNGAAIWVVFARNAGHAAGPIGTVTDNASPPNTYVFQTAADDGGGTPETELWIADNVVGSGLLTISWTAGAASATSIAAVAFQGQATPSLRALGAPATKVATGGQDILSGSVTTASAGDAVVLLVGSYVGGQPASYQQAPYPNVGTGFPQASTNGSTSNSAVGLFLAPSGPPGSQTIESAVQLSAFYASVYFAASVAVAPGPPPATVVNVVAAASVDNGNGVSSGSLTLGIVPNHAAVWVAFARNASHTGGNIGAVTDNATPPNTYSPQYYADGPGDSSPEIELWVADNVTGSGGLVISWTAVGASATSVAAVAMTGCDSPSMGFVGPGADADTGPISSSQVTTNLGDLVMLLVGSAATAADPGWMAAGLSAIQTSSTGSGSNSAVAMLAQRYGATGPHAIAADTTGPTGINVWFSAQVKADDIAVSASGTPGSGPAPLLVAFASMPSGGQKPYSFAWNFGDGGTSTNQNPSHTYASPGTYNAFVAVTDSIGNFAVAPVTITVTGGPSPGPSNLSVTAAVSPNWGPGPPLDVKFTSQAYGGTGPYTYSWDFGDGTGSSQEGPSHSYAATGWYTPTVTATDSLGHTASSRLTVTVGLPTSTTSGGGNNTQPCAQGILAPVQVLPSGPALETLPVPASINNVPSAYYDLCYQVYKNPDGSAAILVPPPRS